MMGTRWPRLAVLLLPVIGACGSTAAEGARSSGVDHPLKEVPQTQFTVGRAEGQAYESFSHVAHVGFDASENLYVLDRGAGKVLVFDRAGRFVREMGSQGRGPGELQMPLQIVVTRDGFVVVSDIGKRAYTIFGVDGRFIRTLPFEDSGMLAGMDVRPHPHGGFVSVSQSPPSARANGGVVRMTWHSPTQGAAPRTLLELGLQPESFSAPVSTPDERTFLPRLQWGLLPDGRVAVSGTPEYRLEIAAADGSPDGLIERPLRPRRVTHTDRVSERRRQRALHKGHGAAALPAAERQALDAQVERLRFARVMPVINELALDPFGNVWVRRERAGEQVVDLLTTDGRYVGTMTGNRLPLAFSPGGLAAYVEEDSLGVSRVTVRRLPSEWLRRPAGQRTAGR